MVLGIDRMGRVSNCSLLRPRLVGGGANPAAFGQMLTVDRRICMIIAFSIYTMAGREIFMKRGQLRAFSQLSSHPIDIENPFTSFKTTEVHITSELAPLPNKPVDEVSVKLSHGCPDSDRGYDRYTVTIAAAPMSTRLSMPSTACGDSLAHRQHRAAMEANTAAWGYTKIALLFFISLLVTWVSRTHHNPLHQLLSERPKPRNHGTHRPEALTLTSTGPLLYQPRLLPHLSRPDLYALYLRLLCCSTPDGLLELRHLYHHVLARL